MNYLIINGSPRRENTWKVVERIKDTLSDNDTSHNFNEINLGDINLPQCTGCYNCFNNGEHTCPHHEIISPIVSAMKSCDGFIITSPVYALNVTGLVKNFIDHLAYFYHRPYFFKKKALIVVTTAGSGHKKVGDYLDETLRNWGYNERFKLCFIHAHDGSGRLPLKTKKIIDKTTNQFYNSIAGNQLKSPDRKALFNYNLWRAMAYNAHIELDNKYWIENNMMSSEFHPDIPCNVLKKIPYKIFYRILLGFLSKNTVE
ncbi:NAD(P)H-dependent oxidoreductase [Methanosphaera sp.]